MILNTGNRTDIPAFYAKWLMRRIKEGFVWVRNPYVPKQIIQYRLDPAVVDAICFCTKNPGPILPYMEELSPFRTFWMVTITPYGKEIEPYIANKRQVLQAFRTLSNKVGPACVSWRYDPIFLNETYTLSFHIQAFEQMAKVLSGYTQYVIISFIDLYEKTKKNFPTVQEVSKEDQVHLVKAFVEIAKKYGMHLQTYLEDSSLENYGVDGSGCLSQRRLEDALEISLSIPTRSQARKGCSCLLGSDIGMYNTCMHGCLYCYANANRPLVEKNAKQHDPDSPLLIGHIQKEDTILEAKQVSWLDEQNRLF